MSKPKETKPRALISTIPVWCRYDEAADVETLVENPKNPNHHPEKQIALLSKIIRAQGWRAPITVSNRSGFIVKGHGRLQAARLLQVAQVPVERQDYATEAEEWQDMIADNRIAELAEIDNAALKDLLQDLDTGETDMDLTGFDAAELERLMNQFHDPNFEPGTEDDQGRLDELAPKPVCCPKCGERFDAREQL